MKKSVTEVLHITQEDLLDMLKRSGHIPVSARVTVFAPIFKGVERDGDNFKVFTGVSATTQWEAEDEPV